MVKPEIYDGNGSDSLKEFLREYEHYFRERYDGNDRQKAKMLGEFLSGEARNCYDAIRGNKMTYTEVKRKLKDWYKQQRIDRITRAENLFEKAYMRETESLHIYASVSYTHLTLPTKRIV